MNSMLASGLYHQRPDAATINSVSSTTAPQSDFLKQTAAGLPRRAATNTNSSTATSSSSSSSPSMMDPRARSGQLLTTTWSGNSAHRRLFKRASSSPSSASAVPSAPVSSPLHLEAPLDTTSTRTPHSNSITTTTNSPILRLPTAAFSF